MVELMPGSGVFVFVQDIEECKKAKTVICGTPQHGWRMAKLFMNKFWSREEFVGSSLANTPGKRALDQRTTSAIKGFCVQPTTATYGQIRQAMASKLTSATVKDRLKRTETTM
ncbi:uncharacterized protein LOC110440995 [Mizuhopecten yessoensis]|uniref:BEN domain-containing protein n=1 Tax=Mizuhopecten yessoensis TaxID=6573 RepID=A0A210PK53_MIZYE|nr:uncharacterized protein LOC110440995 [Mizuhopecten yessoensis]OWF36879.1 hypothetical protein KP79_PYT02714 [Mizuhopecten yessoensis]